MPNLHFDVWLQTNFNAPEVTGTSRMIDILINKAANIFRASVIVMKLSLNDAMIGTVHL